MKTEHALRGLKFATVALAGWLLCACASVRTADADVSSFSGQAAAVAGATYRLEQLPSQGKQPLRAEIEAMADAALASAGLKRDDAAARYSVEVALVSEQYLRQPVFLLSRHSRFVMASDRTYWPYFHPASVDTTLYRYQLRMVMRETSSARVAYETTAELEVPWSDSINMVPALLKAALRDYPLPPVGARKVQVELGQPRTPQP